MAIGKEGNVKWVDGLRGLASLLVVVTHVCRAFAGILFSPSTGDHAAAYFLQWPLVRVFIQGRIGVTYFAFVTGYVCALKPIKLCQQGSQDAALASIAKSAVRRVPRLLLPTIAATLVSFVLTELGAFEIVRHSDSFWLRGTALPRSENAFAALNRLLQNMLTTWTTSVNELDPHHWTLLPLLQGSMTVYIFLVATAYVQQRYRMVLSLGMFLYYYVTGQAAWGMQFFWGVLLADLQNNDAAAAFAANNRTLRRVVAPGLFVLGLFVASFPETSHEWTGWSQALHDVLGGMTPANAVLIHYASGLGLELMTLALHLSPAARDLLSHRALLWFGRNSFAVYLLHGPLMRSVLCWMLYGVRVPAEVRNLDGTRAVPELKYPGDATLLMVLPVWFGVLYGCAMLWTTYLDPWCARVTEKLVAHIKVGSDEKAVPLLPS